MATPLYFFIFCMIRTDTFPTYQKKGYIRRNSCSSYYPERYEALHRIFDNEQAPSA